ncbi:cysteine--tRNA ligase [Candidatus Poriferisocius sp.]|uniref:cysteine--tRNA ligase n=1 Tax=Candidatus Poriferisocius sp. TaxID=3101276 RepID=UPI003B5A8B74
MVSLYDTRRRKVVPFEPLHDSRVSMYVCGPTVYDVPHVGHARTAFTFDMIRRYLQWRGFEVTFVSNITDIDDKIIARAAETGSTEPELAARYERAYVEQMDRFGIAPPDHRPHATAYIDPMLAFIADLIDREAAYVIDGKGVYFSVDAHDRYGDLIGRTPDELREGAGARVEVDVEKTDPLDFALWKAAKPGEPLWESPWGPGRPGWHIECVAMAGDLLGDPFDIHGGGDDLAFPHHQNEVAEAEAAGLGFARYWIHGAMLNVNGEKMAKSLGNFTTLSDLLDACDPQALRLLMLQTHYRTVMELSDDALAGATAALDRLRAWQRRATAAGVDPAAEPDPEAVVNFTEAMDHDFGTPAALAVVFDLVREANAALDAADADRAATAHAAVGELTDALGLALPVGPAPGDDALAESVEALLAQRDEARKARDFAAADRIRDQLADQGIILEDTAGGTVWRRA